MVDLIFEKLPEYADKAIIPFYQHEGDSGFDFSCAEEFTLYPGERKLITTGLRMEIQEEYEVQVRPRSGLAFKHGITVLNTPGTIDSNYRGEVKILLINHGNNPVSFNVGDRIAQGVVCSVIQAKTKEGKVNLNTNRNIGGFGSTGISTAVKEKA